MCLGVGAPSATLHPVQQVFGMFPQPGGNFVAHRGELGVKCRGDCKGTRMSGDLRQRSGPRKLGGMMVKVALRIWP